MQIRSEAVFVILALVAGPLSAESPYSVAWVRQIGSAGTDCGRSVAVDAAGNAYLCGYTAGSFGGPNAGYLDPFLSKYTPAGELVWTSQAGTEAVDYAYGVAIDGAGNAYTCGVVEPGYPDTSYGVMTKYDNTGGLLWSRPLGTGYYPTCSVAARGADGVYLAGSGTGGSPGAGSADAFLAKSDAEGSLVWGRQVGTAAADYANSVALDAAGNVYVGGGTAGSLAGPNAGQRDAFLRKCDSAGTVLWTRQLGTSADDSVNAVVTDAASNVYLAGQTLGSLGGPSAGGLDAFLVKYDALGTLLWKRQLGTAGEDVAYGAAVDGAGNVYIGGYTEGALGSPNAGLGADVFVSKYDSLGDLIWTQQVGSPTVDRALSLALDGQGNIYLAGHTYGSLGGPKAGIEDAFLMKLAVPEPATLSLLTIGATAILRQRSPRALRRLRTA